MRQRHFDEPDIHGYCRRRGGCAQQIIDNPNGYYFNVHTTLNPGGAARGQLVKQ